MSPQNNLKAISKSDPFVLLNWLQKNFIHTLPNGIHTDEEMRYAGDLLGRLTNEYAYLASLETGLDLYVQSLKGRCGKKPSTKDPEEMAKYLVAKDEYDMMVNRKKAVSTFAEISKKSYNSVSRMITVRLKDLEELNMSESRAIRQPPHA